MTMIEAIEGRTLFAANISDRLIASAEASTSPAVQATLELVKSDLTAVNNARGGNARVELQQIVDSGLARLATARDALRQVRDADPAIRDAALATFKSTRTDLAATLAAARDNLRKSAVEDRAALREATTSLRGHLNQLRRDLHIAARLQRYAKRHDLLGSRGGTHLISSGNGLTAVGYFTNTDLGATQFKGVSDVD